MSYSYDLFLLDSSIFVEASQAETVAQILIESGYETDADESGNITGFTSDGSAIRGDEELYQALAPYMRSGSFLELCDEMGNIWRWVFNNGNCGIVYAVVLWPNPGAPPELSQQIHKAFAQHLMAH